MVAASSWLAAAMLFIIRNASQSLSGTNERLPKQMPKSKVTHCVTVGVWVFTALRAGEQEFLKMLTPR